jgi:hypothetical protein
MPLACALRFPHLTGAFAAEEVHTLPGRGVRVRLLSLPTPGRRSGIQYLLTARGTQSATRESQPKPGSGESLAWMSSAMAFAFKESEARNLDSFVMDSRSLRGQTPRRYIEVVPDRDRDQIGVHRRRCIGEYI